MLEKIAPYSKAIAACLPFIVAVVGFFIGKLDYETVLVTLTGPAAVGLAPANKKPL